MKRLQIASLNVFGMSINPSDLLTRYQAIADFFNSSDVDVIHFQEVFSYIHLKILKKALVKYPFCAFNQSIIGPMGGLVIFSKFSLTKTSFTKFDSKDMPLLSIPELVFQKGVLSAQLNDLEITLVNTHFTAVIDHNWSFKGNYYKKIIGEIKTFQSAVEKYRNSNLVISSGDFNIEKGSNLYKMLINIKNLYYPFRNSTQATRHQEFMSDNRKANCIDYLFIIGKQNYHASRKLILSEKVRLKDKKMGYVSDHIGLQLTIEFNI